VSCDHDQGALGQGGRGGGQGTDVYGDLDRVGQDRVGAVGLAGQDIGNVLQEQGRRPPRAPRASPATAASASARIWSTPSRHSSARRSAIQGSIVLDRASVLAANPRSAAAQR
jgi:hypothetical protein